MKTPAAASAPSSLQRAIIRSLVALLVPVTLVSGSVSYLVARRALLTRFDHESESKARALVAMIHPTGDGRLDFDYLPEVLPEFRRRRDPEYFQIWRAGAASPDAGDVLAKAATPGSAALPFPRGVSPHGRATAFTLPDGRSGRLLSILLPVSADEEEDDAAQRPERVTLRKVVVAVARETEPVDETLSTLLVAIIVSSAFIAAGGAWLVRVAVHRSLTPVRQLARVVETLDPANLPKTLAMPVVPAELQPVASGVTGLVSRVTEAIERERRFTSAAAHELRTPLSEIRMLVDVRLRWPDDAAACLKTLTSIGQVNRRMEQLTVTLLDIARGTGMNLQREQVDVSSLVQHCCDELSAKAASRGLRIVTNLQAPLWVLTEPSSLTSIVSNLLSNAAQYAAENTTIQIILQQHDERVDLLVKNAAPTVSPADLDVMFEPFWRQDASRTSPEGGADHLGLGLTVSSLLARRLEGHLQATLEHGELTMRLSLPR